MDEKAIIRSVKLIAESLAVRLILSQKEDSKICHKMKGKKLGISEEIMMECFDFCPGH